MLRVSLTRCSRPGSVINDATEPLAGRPALWLMCGGRRVIPAGGTNTCKSGVTCGVTGVCVCVSVEHML